MTIEYQLPKKRQPIFGFVKGIIKIFMTKKRVVVLGEDLQDKCVYLANHANKMGPVNYDVFFPVYTVKWGAHEMFESYGVRRKYLRDILYIKKNKMGRRISAFKAFFEAFFSPFFYKGVKVLPTYPDARMVKTIKKSVEILENNSAILVFPEDSEDGYKDELTGFHSGFVLAVESYFKKHGEDIPVRPVYLHKKKRLLVAGESVNLRDLSAQGLDRNEIAEYMKEKVNELYRRIVEGEFDKIKA